MRRLLHGSPWVITGPNHWVEDASVLIESGRIVEIGDASDMGTRHADSERVDCTGLILMPGFSNCHNHIYEILCRGLGKTGSLEEWLRHTIYPVTRALTEEDYYYGSLLGAADCLRTGTTGVVSQLTNFARFHADAEARGLTEAGIRGRVVRASSTASTIDPAENGEPEEELESAAAFLDRWPAVGRVQGALGPAGLFSCDPDTQFQLKEMAARRGTKYFTHLNETRHQNDTARAGGFQGQVDWAYRIGLLDRETVVAHAVWSSAAEIAILAATGATVVHNPSSNMILGSGIAPIPQMLDAGVEVLIATDGPASNDSQDMFAEMKAAALLQKVASLDPTVIDAGTIFGMATEAGARVFDLEGAIGRIDHGYLADIVGVRVGDNPAMQPIFDPIAALVYYGSGRDVAFTMIEGEFVYRDGEYPTLDLDQALGFIQTETVPRVRRALNID